VGDCRGGGRGHHAGRRTFAFGPQVVAVERGTTVHWANRDSEAHTVTSDTGAFSA